MAIEQETWVNDVEALCLTVVEGSTPEAAARTLGLRGLTEFPGVASAEDWVRDGEGYDRSWFATGTVDGLLFVWDDNGWQGVTEDVAYRLAAGGKLTSMFWNVDSVMSFLALRDGHVVRMFDPLFHDDEEPPIKVVGEPLPAEGGLDWEHSPRLSGLMLLASVAGTPPVEPGWLSRPGVRFWGHRF